MLKREEIGKNCAVLFAREEAFIIDLNDDFVKVLTSRDKELDGTYNNLEGIPIDPSHLIRAGFVLHARNTYTLLSTMPGNEMQAQEIAGVWIVSKMGATKRLRFIHELQFLFKEWRGDEMEVRLRKP